MNPMDSDLRKTALVIGANGVIGRNLLDHLAALPDWDIIGVSRRGGLDTSRVRYIAADLLDPSESRRKLGGLAEVTHIFYAAYQDRPTWAELVAPNLAMLVHAVEAVEPAAQRLRHISLMQGYKVYGAHLGPFKTPARETDANHMPPEFNIAQQDYLEEKQSGKSWTWSALRPSVVCGYALGNPMNLAMVIAIYASMSKELGIPLRFPGKPGAYHSLLEMTDAGLLARATVWAATEPRCANQAFNITNGDLFRWNELWPKIASSFGLDTAPRSRCPCLMPCRTKSRSGTGWSGNTGWSRTAMLVSPRGHSVISYSPGTMISLPTAPNPAAQGSLSLWIRKPCLWTSSRISAAAGSFPDPRRTAGL